MAHGSLLISFGFCSGSSLQPLKIWKTCTIATKSCSPLIITKSSTNPNQKGRQTQSGKFHRASAGMVECGSRGCRPVFRRDLQEIDSECCYSDNWVCLENASEILWSRIMAFRGKCQEEIVGHNSGSVSFFFKEFAGYLNDVWMEAGLAQKYYERALVIDRGNADLLMEYAEFVSKKLRNVKLAGELLEEAVTLHGHAENVRVWGMYASLLWQTDEL